MILFIAAGVVLLVGHTFTPAIIVATVVCGITFGGASAQLQGTFTSTGGEDSDVASSFLPVTFNLAMFVAGILGASLLTQFDGLVLTVLMIASDLVALALTIYGLHNAFRVVGFNSGTVSPVPIAGAVWSMPDRLSDWRVLRRLSGA